MSRAFKTLMVTGGAGFMGSNFIRYAFRSAGFQGRILNVDKLTYAADEQNLADLAPESEAGRYRLLRRDVSDQEAMNRIVREERVDGIVNFAAESHVDRSIVAAQAFGATNILGTLVLLEAARAAWGNRRDTLFHQVSTDEVYGSCPAPGIRSVQRRRITRTVNRQPSPVRTNWSSYTTNSRSSNDEPPSTCQWWAMRSTWRFARTCAISRYSRQRWSTRALARASSMSRRRSEPSRGDRGLV